jgi:oligopeptide transport system substrate-binding protein
MRFSSRNPSRAASWAPSAAVAAALLALLALLGACSPGKDPGNVYRGALASNLKTLDPAQASDSYSIQSQQQVYETLYEYKYLARPYDVQPCLASAMPEVSPDGLTYTIRVRTDVEFADDPSFPGGKGRRMTARDFVYSLKRLADVRTQTYGWWVFDGKIKGLNAFRDSSEKLPPLPDSAYPALYDREIEGLRALDDSTVRIELTRPYPYFKYILAMPYAAVVAREAVEHYGEEFRSHPVGTGPYVLTEWRRGLRLTFVRNPKYRHGFYPTEGSSADSAAGLLRDAGKALPFVDRVELYVFNETQPMWLNFRRGHLDRAAIPKDNYAQAVTPGQGLQKEFLEQGIRLHKVEELDVVYICVNMKDPVLGKNRALRQAMQLGYDVETVLSRFYNGRGVRAQGPVPPTIFGHEPEWRGPYGRFDLEAARRKLAEAGYPGGKGLPELSYLTVASTEARQRGEHFAQNMAALGIRVNVESATWPEYLERIRARSFQLAGAAWMADYPDPENFMQLLYGPNEPPGANNASYANPEFDRLYEKVAAMPDGPERLEILRRMRAIVAEDLPWIFVAHRVNELLAGGRLRNFKPSAATMVPVKYYRVTP